MKEWTAIVGLSLAALMVFQMSLIARRAEGRWRPTALFYKANILFAVAIAFVGWLVLFVLAMSQPYATDFFKGYNYLLGANEAHAPAAETVGPTSTWNTSAIVILIAFFTGAIRLMFEQS